MFERSLDDPSDRPSDCPGITQRLMKCRLERCINGEQQSPTCLCIRKYHARSITLWPERHHRFHSLEVPPCASGDRSSPGIRVDTVENGYRLDIDERAHIGGAYHLGEMPEKTEPGHICARRRADSSRGI